MPWNLRLDRRDRPSGTRRTRNTPRYEAGTIPRLIGQPNDSHGTAAERLERHQHDAVPPLLMCCGPVHRDPGTTRGPGHKRRRKGAGERPRRHSGGRSRDVLSRQAGWPSIYTTVENRRCSRHSTHTDHARHPDPTRSPAVSFYADKPDRGSPILEASGPNRRRGCAGPRRTGSRARRAR